MNKYYIYAYLDPRKAGKFCYPDLNISFLYEPIYIGKGNEKRKFDHLKESKTNFKKGNQLKLNKIRKIIRETNTNPFILEIYQNLDKLESIEKEKQFIKNIGRIDLKTGPLTNLTSGGEGVSDYVISEQQKKKISIRTKGEKNPNYGNKWNDIQKDNLRKQRIGVCNYKHTKEWKEKLKKYNPGGIKTSMSVLQIDLEGNVIKKWSSVNSASNYIKGIHGNILKSIKKLQRYKGYHWRYPDDPNIINNKLTTIKELNDKLNRKTQKYLIQINPTTKNIIKIWNSMTEACKELTLKISSLSCAIKNKNIYKNYLWESSIVNPIQKTS